MKINLKDYPLNSYTTLHFKRSRFTSSALMLLFLGLSYTFINCLLEAREHSAAILFSLALLGVLICLLISVVCLIDPIAGSILLDSNGITFFATSTKGRTYKWSEMSNIQLNYTERSKLIPMQVVRTPRLIFMVNAKVHSVSLLFRGISDKSEFVELVKKWQQYYASQQKPENKSTN